MTAGGGIARAHTLLACCAFFVGLGGEASAQTITVRVGESADVAVAPNGQVSLPVGVDMSQAGVLDIASLDFRVTWDPAAVTFVSATPGSFGNVTINDTEAASGTLRANLFNSTGTTQSFSAIDFVLEAGAIEGSTTIGLEVLAAGNEEGTSLLSNVESQSLSLCIGVSGLLGDVNGDDVVNIIDAQQIARWAVGLPVLPDFAERMITHGDVTGDGSTNIIDAQQIARWAVGFDVIFPIGEPIPGGCDAASTGTMRITTTFTGSAEAPPEYSLVLDGGPTTTTAASTILWEVTAGSHQLELAGLPQYCAVSGLNPQSVDVPAEGEVQVSFFVACEVPLAPSDLVASSAGPTEVSLDWTDNSVNETEFRVERRTASSGNWVPIGSTATGATSFSDSGVSAGASVEYRVNACHEGGCSGYSNIASITLSAGDLLGFSEDFSGDLSEWVPFGSPPSFIDGGTLNVNGDASWDSGVHTISTGSIGDGIRISWETLRPNLSIPTFFTDAEVGLGQARQGSTPPVQMDVGMRYRPDIDGRIEVIYNNTRINSGTIITERRWIPLRVDVASDGIARYYADNALIFTSPEAIQLSDPSHLVITGRRHHVDNVSVVALPAPTTGSIEVTTTTTGPQPDPDGYTVTIGSDTRSIGINDAITFEDLTVGDYTVVLSDIATNCEPPFETSVDVSVTAGNVATADFNLNCPSTPTMATFTATADASVAQDASVQNTNFGQPEDGPLGGHIVAGFNADGQWISTGDTDSKIWGLVRFDLSSIPTDATVTSATLTLRVRARSDDGGRIDAERITADWNESTVAWSNKPARNPVVFTFNSRESFTITREITAQVQEWVTSPSINFGLVLKSDPGEASTNYFVAFATREDGASDDRPRLTVTYEVP